MAEKTIAWYMRKYKLTYKEAMRKFLEAQAKGCDERQRQGG